MKTLLLTILLLSFGQAQAGIENYATDTGSQLLEQCEAHIDKTIMVKSALCVGFIRGVYNTHETFTNWKQMDKRWCMSDGITYTQAIRVVIKFLQEHPEELHLSASGLVSNAFSDAFPCEKGA
jgi:hypothetical protein